MRDAETPTTYHVPANFSPEGTILSGSLKLRNTVEAGILVVAIAGPLIYFHPFAPHVIAILIVLFALPLGILALVGVNDGSLFEYIGDALSFFCSNRNIVFYSPEESKPKKSVKGGE